MLYFIKGKGVLIIYMDTIGIIANLNKPGVASVSKKIIRFLERHNVKVFLERPLAKAVGRATLGILPDKLAGKADLVIAMGGDGTFLRAARIVQRHLKPILGVNLGGLGFLSEVTQKSLEKGLRLLIKGEYYIDYRMTLDTEVLKKRKRIKAVSALNDVVITKQVLSRIINLEVFVDGEYVTEFKADGIIVSTPTGSTAYNLSAGGPIVYPGSNVIIISPICPHTLTHRPLVVPSTSQIEIRFNAPVKDIELTIDGQVGIALTKDDKVVITEGKEKVPVVLFSDTSYFEVLRRKLRWGSR